MSIRAGTLFAQVHGRPCRGTDECHWCASACERRHPHDDLIVPFVKASSFAKRPGNSYVCEGCWLYRMPRVSVRSLDGSLKDRQSLCDYSWLLTRDGVKVVTDTWKAKQAMYKMLLSPPNTFSLSLLHPMTNARSLLHCAEVNDHAVVKADTPLVYTLDNKAQTYTVYELEEAMRHGADGRMPGVRLLIEVLGPYSLGDAKEEVRRKPGRPKQEEVVNGSVRRVTVSGAA